MSTPGTTIGSALADIIRLCSAATRQASDAVDFALDSRATPYTIANLVQVSVAARQAEALATYVASMLTDRYWPSETLVESHARVLAAWQLIEGLQPLDVQDHLRMEWVTDATKAASKACAELAILQADHTQMQDEIASILEALGKGAPNE